MQSAGKLISLALGVPMLLASMAGCKTTPSTGIPSEVCLIWKPITFSASRDTPETVEEIRAQNARRQVFCEG